MTNGTTWIQSASNTKIDFRHPDPDSFKIEDIALGLSRQPRYAGQGKFFYSVAQHSIYVATQVRADIRIYGLLHDAHEAYMGDIPGPLKSILPEVNEIEYWMDKAIYKGLKLLPPSHKEWCEVMDVDRGMLNAESPVLFDKEMWRMEDSPDIQVRIRPWSEQETIDMFLTYYNSIRNRINEKRMVEVYGYSNG